MEHPEGSIAGFIAHVGDAVARGGPARSRGVELAVGELERVATLCRHQPELIPLPAEIGGVHHPASIATPVGPGLPGGLFVVELTLAAARPGVHPPEPARAPDPTPVGNEDELSPI